MQCKKDYQEKLFASFQLSERIPRNNFYRCLKAAFELDFLYPLFMGLRKINTIGLKQANKCMQLSVIAYNIKEYLKFIEKRSKSGAGQLGLMAFVEKP